MRRITKFLAFASASAAVALLLLGVSPVFAKAHSRSKAVHHTVHSRSSQDASQLFSAKKLPADLPQSSIGSYANGCLAGAEQLPTDGPHWQVMRLSRNRNWGRHALVDFLQNLSERAHKDGWEGLLIGDMGMPRGGPMPTGHLSHQIGLDVDIWLRPAPTRTLSDQEREDWDANSVLTIDTADLDPNIWSPQHAALVKDAAQDPETVRIFVTPAIKQYLCQRKDANGADTEWLRKLRPCGLGACDGHDDHIHVRLHCPKGDSACVEQPLPDPGDGCGQEVSDALQAVAQNPPYQSNPGPTSNTRAAFPMSKLPKACMRVLNAPDKVKP